jgi:arylsulfatase A-like enzyme
VIRTHRTCWAHFAPGRAPQDGALGRATPQNGIAAKRTGPVHRRARVWPLGVLALLPLLLGCWREPEAPPPNIVLITIDTLRSDHLSCYGYDRATTPAIDRIAAMGTVFEQAYATSPWTTPSMASIVTGLSPRTHGVRHGVLTATSTRVSQQEALDPEFPTLATILQAAGYTTFGLTSNAHLAAELGFGRGFDAFATLPFKSAFRLDVALAAWRERIRHSTPRFLWIHYFDPHAPYTSQEPWIGEYDGDRAQRGDWSRMVTSELAAIEEAGAPAGFAEGIESLYDSEINFVDRSIGRLLDELAPLDNTVVVITSDHGEEFLDHGGFGHKHSLHEELLRVPLIIKAPAAWRVERRVDTPVSNQRILSTVLAIAGVETPPLVEATSLLGLMTGSSSALPEPIFADLDTGIASADSVRLGRWKLIIASRPAESMQLFDLESDPKETNDLAAARPEVAADLSARLDAWRRAHPLFEPERTSRSVSEPVMQQLRAMGYVEP